MKAADVMTFRPVTIRASASVEEAARLLLEHRISGLPVVDEAGALVGVVTEGDLVRLSRAASGGKTVGDAMTAPVIHVEEDVDIGAVLDSFERHNIKRVPVLRQGALAGIISRADLLRGLAQLAKVMPGAGAKDRLLRDKVLQALTDASAGVWTSFNVVVRGGDVELRGAVTPATSRDDLVRKVQRISGVKSVKDLLVVVGPASGH